MRKTIRAEDEQRAKQDRSLRFLLPVTLVVIGAGLLMSGFEVESLRTWLKGTGIWAPLLFVFVAIALMSMILPKTAVSISAGILFGTVTGAGLMFLVATCAACLNYSIGRWWLYDSILRKTLSEERSDWLKAIRDVGADAGFGFHFLVRLAPVPTMVISYMMGAVGAKPVPFVAAAAAGAIPQILWVHCGSVMSMVGDSSQTQLRFFSGIVALFAGLLIAVIVPKLVVARVNEERNAMDAS